MILRNTILGIVSSVALVSITQASTLYEVVPPSTTTAVSGGSASNSIKSIGGGNGYKAINRISHYERQDYSCKFKVKMRHLNKYNVSYDSKELLSNCDGDKISGGYSDTETYIRGIQICVRSANQHLKGLRVWGSKLNRSTGALTNVGRVEDTRPNCNQWKPARYCPAGQVVTEIKANYTGSSTNGTYSGVALVCEALVPQ